MLNEKRTNQQSLRIFSVVSLIFGAFAFSPLAAQISGVQNPGFEAGLSGWTITSQADTISVITGTDDSNGTLVSPFKGSSMLRIGSPKDIKEQQNRGSNSVSQTFAPNNDTLRFSFRLFSWEHRGDDIVTINLTDSQNNSYLIHDNNGNPLSITMPDGAVQYCDATPCSFVIDAGKRGQLLDTQWVQAKITGLPVNGENVTLSYSVTGGDNQAHATWGYFDDVNTPPVAKFELSPVNPLEGDFVMFVDKSYDNDPGDSIVDWEWRISGPDIVTQPIHTKNPMLVLPSNGSYDVQLTVWDSFGASTTAYSGGVASDGDSLPLLNVGDAAVKLNALNQEVLVNGEADLLGRFIEPGVLDTHSAQWSVGGVSSQGDVLEEHQPPFASGLVTGKYTAGSTAGLVDGNLTITDSDGSSASDSFVVKVLDDVLPREPNDTIADAKALNSGWVYLSQLEQPGDVDVFEITDANGKPLQAGSEARFELKNLPSDLDLVILTQLPQGTASVEDAPYNFLPYNFLPYNFLPYNFLPYNFLPYNFLPYNFLPYNFLPYNFLPYNFLPYNFLPYNFLPYNFLPYNFLPYNFLPVENSPYLNASSVFEQFRLSELGYANFDQENLGSGDTTLSELGLSGIGGTNIRIAGYSSNRGLDSEGLLVKVSHTGARLFAVVVGHNGNYGRYALQVETSSVVDREELLGESCNGTPLVDAAHATTNVEILHQQGGAAKTLFLTQMQRMETIYGLDGVQSQQLKDTLTNLADHELVKADIISVPSNIYDDWDSRPCNVDAANGVALAIKQIVKDYLATHPSIEDIVLLGSDNVVPQYRIVDGTSVGNERLYGSGSFLLPNTPLASSIEEGFFLSDDFYASINAQPWQGRELYLPNLAIARLVESPADIMRAATQFISVNGQLPMSSALVSGYDFFKDGAQLTADKLSSGTTTTRLINDSWSADEFQCDALGQTSDLYPNCTATDVTGFNAHFSHFAAVSALGFADLASGDIITSEQVLQSPAVNSPRLIFSMGCHSALNVPDGEALPKDLLGLPADPNLDFAQALTSNGGVFIGNTGHGYGDTDGVGGSEKLLALFADEIANGGSVGQAMKMAKLKYFGSLTAPTLIDEKAVVQTTMFGLPMYQVQAGAFTPVDTMLGPQETAFDLTMHDGGSTSTATYNIERVEHDNGTFFVIDGDHQATATRAIQPRLFTVLDGATPAHGVVIRGGSYYDYNDFDAVISRQTNEWEVGAQEPNICVNAFWPTEIARVNLVESDFHTAVIVPGQFRCTSVQQGNVIGTQRLFTSLDMDVTRSDSTDYIPPVVEGVSISNNGGTTLLTVTANDAGSGIGEVVVLLLNNGVITSKTSGPVSGNGDFVIDVGNLDSNTQARVEVIDGAGNVANYAAKGASLHAISVDAGPDQIYGSGQPVTIAATIANFEQLRQQSDSMTYTWEFGDNAYANGLLFDKGGVASNVVVATDGSATFSTTHTYFGDTDYLAKLKVSDSFGGVGDDQVLFSPCGDPADLSSVDPNIDYTTCAMSLKGTKVSITVGVAGVISDGAQYRLYLDLGTSKTGGIPDGNADLKLQYHGGIANGLTSLVVTPVGDNALRFDFDLAELGWSGDRVDWSASTQDGVPGGQSLGHVDYMPDSGFFTITQ